MSFTMTLLNLAVQNLLLLSKANEDSKVQTEIVLMHQGCTVPRPSGLAGVGQTLARIKMQANPAAKTSSANCVSGFSADRPTYCLDGKVASSRWVEYNLPGRKTSGRSLLVRIRHAVQPAGPVDGQ